MATEHRERDMTEYEKAVGRRARAIYESSIPHDDRYDEIGPTYHGIDKAQRQRLHNQARATLKADDADGYVLVKREATEEMLNNAHDDKGTLRVLDFVPVEERDGPFLMSKTIWRAAIAAGAIDAEFQEWNGQRAEQR